jgi:IMP dehydrogenase
MNFKEALTFDDVLLVPQYSDLKSRGEADTSTKLGEISLKIPILSANMSCVTGRELAQTLGLAGAGGVLHRYQDFEIIKSWVLSLLNQNLPAIPSVGVSEMDRENAKQYALLTPSICVDIAHGDSKLAVDMVKFCKDLGFRTIIAGNICTRQGALRLIQAGANVVKCGIGSGAICSTRLVSGHGYPQLSAILEVARIKETHPDVGIIADGGMSNSGDIVKALAAGADAVMSGSLFAGYDECEDPNSYAGMASEKVQLEHHGKVNNSAPEGVSFTITPKGPVLPQLHRLAGGIRSGMSYSGACTLQQLRNYAEFVRVTSSTVVENSTRKLT